jgi:long-chain acyl-CoA synthetase
MFRSLYEPLCQTANDSGDHVAWIVPQNGSIRSIRWSELRLDVDRLACWLESNGVKPQDRVVNTEPNSLGWAILDLACAAIGAIHAPIDPRWTELQTAQAIESLEPRAVFGTQHLQIATALEQATSMPKASQQSRWQETVRTDQTANILWTSGTSAQPKGVMLSHNNLLSNGLAKLDAMPQTASDIRLNLLPFAHGYARTCELTAWLLSRSAMACVASYKSNSPNTAPTRALGELAQIVRPTLINAVPSAFQHWLQLAQMPSLQAESSGTLQSFFGGHVRQFASGGAPIADAIRTRFAEESLPIFQGYGLTEASPVVCSNRAQCIRNGKVMPEILEGVGPAVQGVQVRIDHEGRLSVRGPGVMQGYWRDEQATEARIVDGWLDTGDIVSMQIAPLEEPSKESTAQTSKRTSDLTKPIRIAGRADDVQVLSNGYKFAPLELERKIEQINSIAQCVVVGGDRRAPLAILCLKPDANRDKSELLIQIHQILAHEPEHLRTVQIVLSPEDWTIQNGLRHWKGGVNRVEIARKFAH